MLRYLYFNSDIKYFLYVWKTNNSFISHDLCNDFLLQYVTELHNLLALSVEDQDYF